jgi:predicted ABC-type ATPase
VPPAKVEKRWHGSLKTGLLAVAMVDELWLYDNSAANRSQRLIGRFASGKKIYQARYLQAWAKPFFSS